MGSAIRLGGVTIGHTGDNSPLGRAVAQAQIAQQPTLIHQYAHPAPAPTPTQSAPTVPLATPAAAPRPAARKAPAAAPAAPVAPAPAAGGQGDGGGSDAAPSRSRRLASFVRSVLPEGLIDRVANAPTPGGLGPVLFALIVLLFAVVPVGVGGRTRLQLVWGALTGGVDVPPSAKRQTIAATQSTDNRAQAIEQAAQADWNAFWGAI